MSSKEGPTEHMPAHVILKTANREVEIREESQIPTYLHALAAQNSFTIPTSSKAFNMDPVQERNNSAIIQNVYIFI